MKKIIIIGAGASGLMAAISAASSGAAVTVLEGMEKPGKKIQVTGNGRCNLTNTYQQRLDRYRGAATEFTEAILEKFTVKDTLLFFESLGLLLQNKDGYIYPYVNQASAVLDVLLMEARRLGVKVKCSEKVMRLEYEQAACWKVYTQSWCYEADAVILAAGSKAAPQTGSDGSGYELARQAGHRIIEPREALVPLKAKEKWIKRLSGVRMPAEVTVSIKGLKDQFIRYTETGEIQWTDYGISGIVVFQLSRYAVNALACGEAVTATIDLMPDYSVTEILSLLQKKKRFGTAEEFMTGILPKKVIPVILELSGLKTTVKSAELAEKQLLKICDNIKGLRITITGSKAFDSAQVCSGGVDTTQVYTDTLESKKKKGLYFAGELLDVDGICGGYNLQWAWSSGFVSGRAAASDVKS